MNIFKKAAVNTMIGLWITTSVFAQTPKTDSTVVSTKKELTENIENNIDQKTAVITKVMGGFASKAEIEKMLVDNGLKKTDAKYISFEPDILLYKTIQELSNKYGNPKITFKRPKLVQEKYDGHFTKHSNTIKINLKRLINKIKNDKNISFQREIVDIRLIEMSHGKQTITMKKKIRDLKIFIKNGFDYDKMYDTKWTIEYEAHTILQPEVIDEFMEDYISKIDTTNDQEIKRAEFIFDRYTYTKKWGDMTKKNLDFILGRRDEMDLNKMQK